MVVAVAVGAFAPSAWLYSVTALFVAVGIAGEVWRRKQTADRPGRPAR